MWRHCLVALLALTMASGLAPAEGDGKKDKTEVPGTSEAEVRFADGSNVRVLILQQSLDIVTKYGKLTIPASEIRRIEFGLHLTAENEKKIAEAIRQLGSDTFSQRDAASKELLALGALAYPAVKAAAKNTDAEVAQRTQALLKLMREKIPPRQLALKDYDLIQTVEFPVTGRIASATIKARTAYFGDLDLKVTELRGIRWQGSNDEVEVVVDAAKYANPNDNQWLDTGVTLEPDTAVEITATGQVNLRPAGGGRFVTGPAGTNQFGQQGQFPCGALLGRVGESGTVFVIGDRLQNTSSHEGKLYLQIAPNPWNDQSSGTYKVKIATGRFVGAGR
jgi:hypothetical protein